MNHSSAAALFDDAVLSRFESAASALPSAGWADTGDPVGGSACGLRSGEPLRGSVSKCERSFPSTSVLGVSESGDWGAAGVALPESLSSVRNEKRRGRMPEVGAIESSLWSIPRALLLLERSRRKRVDVILETLFMIEFAILLDVDMPSDILLPLRDGGAEFEADELAELAPIENDDDRR